MEPDKIREMVRRQVNRYLSLAETASGARTSGRSLLCVINRADPLIGRVLYQLRELEESGVGVTLFMPENVSVICRKEGLMPIGNIECITENEVEKVLLDINMYYLVLFPVMGFSLAERIADLDDDDIFANIAIRALQSGKNVTVVDETISAPRTGIAAPEMAKRAARLHKRISGTGIRVIPLSGIGKDMTTRRDTFEGKVVTEDTVKEYHGANIWDINVPPMTVVTPLAKDKAKELGIRINILLNV